MPRGAPKRRRCVADLTCIHGSTSGSLSDVFDHAFHLLID